MNLLSMYVSVQFTMLNIVRFPSSEWVCNLCGTIYLYVTIKRRSMQYRIVQYNTDYGRSTIKNSKTQANKGTKFSKRGTISCDNGYSLSSGENIKCEASGSWGSSSTCLPKDNFLIFEYERQVQRATFSI